MNTETKQPAAGEFWQAGKESNGVKCIINRVRVIAVDNDQVIYRDELGDIDYLKLSAFVACFRHLPDCDSFDWKETVYPRYAVPVDDNDPAWRFSSYVVQENQWTAWCVKHSGVKRNSLWLNDETRCKLVSREEAEARHARLHRELMISQLVVIDREKWPDHVPRVGVDWKKNKYTGTLCKVDNTTAAGLCCLKQYRDYIEFRCLPKDLPPEPVAVSPGRSFRTVKMEFKVSGTTLYVCKVPLTIEGPVSVELTLDDLDPAKVVSRTVHLMNEEEF